MRMFKQHRFKIYLLQSGLKLLKRSRSASEHAVCSLVSQVRFVRAEPNCGFQDVYLKLCKIDREKFRFLPLLMLGTN